MSALVQVTSESKVVAESRCSNGKALFNRWRDRRPRAKPPSARKPRAEGSGEGSKVKVIHCELAAISEDADLIHRPGVAR